MKILFYSRPFSPSIGGVESVTRNLAESLTESGNEVAVLTETLSNDRDEFPFRVIRRPTAKQFMSSVKWADIFVHQGVSLRAIWPLVFIRKPWVVVHHIWLPAAKWWRDPLNWLKRQVICFANRNVAVSIALAKSLEFPVSVIANSYDERIFQEQIQNPDNRKKDLIFVGRLIREKGADVILAALQQLKKIGFLPSLTIVGGGQEEDAYHRIVRDSDLTAQVEFAGIRQGYELAELLNQHRILVVPSSWAEPFGIVALEGIACGCVVVGSDMGGLPEAIGPCGPTFPNKDVLALTQCLRTLLEKNGTEFSKFRANAKEHLRAHTKENVAKSYLLCFRNLLNPTS